MIELAKVKEVYDKIDDKIISVKARFVGEDPEGYPYLQMEK